jgi:peroxiredoxin family protein
MPEKLGLIVTSGTREKLQMAAMMAAVAGACGTEVSVFLSMNALVHFIDGRDAPAPCEGEVGRLLEAKNAPPFLELFRQAVELGGAKLHPCSMAMDVLAVSPAQLLPFLEPPMGLTKFLSEMGAGQSLTF